ncbi:hypothetical protein PDQ75_24835 [Bacillus cereus group sp. Bc015]|uniref:hypothetical protein n=1 Tax=Bacillus cereus group sp. Bc015 TaxID=3018123 RepID=UPI0022E6F53A|nr:hypothetical protein [Bacillus cereus group sp. Bc015]MDA2738384.1 hypothetical protein [Bacillus cereus group sp. Bc015]
MFVKNLMPKYSADGGSAGGTGETGEGATGGVVTEKTDTPVGEKGHETMIPKTRFDEINAKYKEMAKKVAEFEKAQAEAKAEAERKELEAKKEQGKFEELYTKTQKELEAMKTYQTRATELESVIQSMVETKLQSVPKEMQDLVPSNLSAEATLDWLNKAESKGLFGKQEVKEIGKPSNKSNESPKVDKANLSPLDKILAGLGK